MALPDSMKYAAMERKEERKQAKPRKYHNTRLGVLQSEPEAKPSVDAVGKKQRGSKIPACFEEFRCAACGRSYEKDKQSAKFPHTSSPFFKGNNNRLPICTSCFQDFYMQYVKIFMGDERAAVERMCMHFDMFYSDMVYNATAAMEGRPNRITDYIRRISVNTDARGKNYDNYLDECKAMTTMINENGGVSAYEGTAYDVRVWGIYTDVEYVVLNTLYKEWADKCEITDITREKLVRDWCILELQKRKALEKDDNIDLYSKLLSTQQKTLDAAKLTPKQIEAEIKASEKPLGVLLEMVENTRPIAKPLPEWEDVDGIMKLILVYFVGHLCKMLKIHNRYCKMYEEEMERYRVKVPELEQADDESVFEYVVNHSSEMDGDDDGEG